MLQGLSAVRSCHFNTFTYIKKTVIFPSFWSRVSWNVEKLSESLHTVWFCVSANQQTGQTKTTHMGSGDGVIYWFLHLKRTAASRQQDYWRVAAAGDWTSLTLRWGTGDVLRSVSLSDPRSVIASDHKLDLPSTDGSRNVQRNPGFLSEWPQRLQPGGSVTGTTLSPGCCGNLNEKHRPPGSDVLREFKEDNASGRKQVQLLPQKPGGDPNRASADEWPPACSALSGSPLTSTDFLRPTASEGSLLTSTWTSWIQRNLLRRSSRCDWHQPSVIYSFLGWLGEAFTELNDGWGQIFCRKPFTDQKALPPPPSVICPFFILSISFFYGRLCGCLICGETNDSDSPNLVSITLRVKYDPECVRARVCAPSYP